MKKCLFLFMLVAGLMACDKTAKQATGEVVTMETDKEQPTQAVSNNKASAEMKFENYEYDFGTIKEGDVVDHTFKFTNTGSTPLIIQNAVGSCGCTVPEWPHEPVAPGAAGEIKVKFNSSGKGGVQSKTVTITANTQPDVTTLTLKGLVNTNEVTSMQGPVRSN